MAMPRENRRFKRVKFDRGFECQIMAINGTWRCPCAMQDASDTGAKLTLKGKQRV